MSVKGRDLVLGFVLDGLNGELLLALLRVTVSTALHDEEWSSSVASLPRSVVRYQAFWWFISVLEKEKGFYSA